jgi:hypothetical protein
VSAVKKVDFVSDTMSYIVLRGRWCNIIVMNVHVTSEEKVMIQRAVLWEIRVGVLSFA